MVKNAVSEERLTVDVDEPGLGRAQLRRLAWDSDFFGDMCGVVEVEISPKAKDPAHAAASLLGAISRKAREAGYLHVICRVGGYDWAAVHGAQLSGWLIVDVATDLICQPLPPAVASRRRADSIRDALPEDLPDLEDLAGVAFTYSRFSADPFFSADQVQAFHRQWIRNLANGQAQSVLVYEDAGRPLGFIACSLQENTARIVLIASSPSYRLQGVGAALVDAGLIWAHGAGATTVYVKTQAANIGALRLYERAGFLPYRCEITLSANLRGSQATMGGQP